MSKKIIWLPLVLTFISAGCHSSTNTTTSLPQKQVAITSVMIGKKTVKVEVMDTDEKRSQGLSGRTALPDGQGLLFDFTNVDNRLPGFWMKEMLFDIDILWIADNKVIAINRNVPKPDPNIPLRQLPVYYPPAEVDYVLEVPAGFSERNKIEIGELAKFR